MASASVTFSQALTDLVERVSPSVVAVKARPRFSSSGVLWRPGVIVTAAHTVRYEDGIQVTLPDGRSVAAQLSGSDARADIAVLKAETGAAVAIDSSSATAARAGQLLLAIGRASDGAVLAHAGIASAVGPEWRTWRGGRIERLLRLDVNLHPRASGSAVVDAAGKLLGIATFGLSRFAPVAIPVETINRLLDPLLARGYLPRGYLGVGLHGIALPAELAEKLKLQYPAGLIVLSAEAAGPAARAGATIGDIIVAINGAPLAGTADVQRYLEPEAVGKALTLRVVRGGELKELDLTVGERPRA